MLWNNALEVLHNLNMKLVETPHHNVEAIETAIADQEEVSSSNWTHRTFLGAVKKLELLWSVDLDLPVQGPL